jgi:ABC-type enterochelin transport system ATPase subunit
MLNKDGSNASSSLSSHTYSDNVIVVHAGFVPGVALEEQEVQTMTTIREVVEVEVDVNSAAGQRTSFESCPIDP